ncbi:MAG: universal stress protein [Promethearchaeota archaeon]|jgi:nucleotide-binding universal stress UspA family protein
MKNILAPIDFSDITKEVIEHAADMTRTFSGKLWLIHVAPPDPEFVGHRVGPQSVRDAVAEELHEEHRQLQHIAKDIRSKGIDVTSLLVQGSTIETILKEASKVKADLIVLGSHGHGALYTALLGSVPKGILRKSPCPLFIIPARK